MAILESQTKTGLSWVRESLDMFKQSPRKWLMLALVYIGLFLMVPSLPGFQIFAVVVILAWPIFIAVAMRLFRNTEVKKVEDLSTTMRLLQPKMAALLQLGLVCILYGFLVSILLGSDAQVFFELSQAQNKAAMTEQEAAEMVSKLFPILIKIMLALVPLMVATWFSPMLIAFNGYSLFKAIKSSVAGSLQYMVAMTVSWVIFFIGFVTIVLFISIVVGLFSAILPLPIALSLRSFLMFGFMMFAIALMLAFQYVTYRDVFRAAKIAY